MNLRVLLITLFLTSCQLYQNDIHLGFYFADCKYSDTINQIGIERNSCRISISLFTHKGIKQYEIDKGMTIFLDINNHIEAICKFIDESNYKISQKDGCYISKQNIPNKNYIFIFDENCITKTKSESTKLITKLNNINFKFSPYKRKY